MFFPFQKVLVALSIPALLLCGCAKKSALPTPLPPTYAQSPHLLEEVWKTDDVDISGVNADKKLVALTFDDAPTQKLNALLDVFLSFNKSHPNCPAYATLFCNGKSFSRHKESLYTAFAMGIELGNHAFSHLDLTTLEPDQLHQEITAMDALLEEIDGKQTHLFRAPYGRVNDKVIRAVNVPIIDWYIDTEDWSTRQADILVERVFSRLHDGVIVLMHDGYQETVDGVKMLLPLLYEQGYQAVSVSQMAKAHGCRLQTGKIYTRARKQI